MEKNVMFSVYIDNLGKRGLGEWVDFPITIQEQKELLDRLQISSEPNEFGECFEETINCDYENFPLSDVLGEYVSIEMLNKIALLMEKLQEVDEHGVEMFVALCEEFSDFDECMTAAQNILDNRLNFIPGVKDMYDVAQHIIDEFGVEGLENSEFYIDYAAIGEAVESEHFAEEDGPENAGEYWCGDPDASYEQIGMEVVDNLGFESLNSPENFINWEMLANDLRIEGNYVFTETGCVDLNADFDYQNEMPSDYLDTLLEEFNNKGKNAPVYEDEER